jgi:gamma-glutamyl-gamma-aminobutyrate hydrolase PuuD
MSSSSKRKGEIMKKEEKKTRPKCWVIGGGFDYIRLLFNLGIDGATSLEDADFVLFTGGEDVYPGFYGEAALAKTNYNRTRDEFEKTVYEAALERGLPMVGICRGGQFLNVMNKGKMWQHVNNHCGSHLMFIEVPPFNGDKRRNCMVTSTHHQMMIPTDDAIILGTAAICMEKLSPGVERLGRNDDDPDIEVVFYQDTNCLCFQPHPELKYATPECVDFFEECLDNWIYPAIPNETAKAIIKPSLTAKL